MNIEQKAALFDKIVNLMGSVDDGSDVTVKLFEDDATRTFHVIAGSGCSEWGLTLAEAIENAWSEFGVKVEE